MKPNGHVIYSGPSMLDRKPIVAIVTGFAIESKNRKSGGSPLQTWILREDVDPLEATRTGEDASICGDCRHRGHIEGGRNIGRSCYVEVHFGVRNVWLAYRRGSYPACRSYLETIALGQDQPVRLGSYGDPAAVPVLTWQALTLNSPWHLGYTHQWRKAEPALKDLCMASVDSRAEMMIAGAAGWRTFRVRTHDQETYDREVTCPASAEAGKKTSCEECRACGGLKARARADIAIVAHGAVGRIGNFNRRVAHGRLFQD